jgi:hypothetical protein
MIDQKAFAASLRLTKLLSADWRKTNTRTSAASTAALVVLALARRQWSGAVDRKGNVVARVVENVRADTLEAFVHEVVSHKVLLLCTDQWVGYKHLGKEYPHAVIDHAHLQCSPSQKTAGHYPPHF